jgi:hypothetical protein
VNDINAKRRYSEPTKSDYIIRCMAAENTVRQQNAALTAETQARAKAELENLWLTDENARLRRVYRVGIIGMAAISIAGIISIYLLLGGAQ